MKLLDERGLTTVWAAIKNTFTSKSDADEKYAKKSEGVKAIRLEKTQTGDDGAMSQLIHVIKANDGQNFLSIYNADNRMDGFMSKEDKVKLDGIASGANNYTLPVATASTLGGIKVGYGGTLTGFNFPVELDDEGNAVATINGLFCISGVLKSIEFTDGDTSTNYGVNSIYHDTHSGEIKFDFPSKAGTFALTSDIPTKTSQLTNDSKFLTSADKYILPVASQNTLGGILSQQPLGNNINLWPVTVSASAIAYTNIAGLNRGSNGDIRSIIINDDNYSTTYSTTSIQKQNKPQGTSTLFHFPLKSGTLALTSDIPTKTSQLINDSGFLKQGDFECTINIYLIDTQSNSDKLKGVSITIEQQGEDVLYAIWDGSPISFTADAKAKIKISVSHADGYITPNAVEFKTVIGRDEDITFTYTPAHLGVYICDTDNKLTLPDNWDSSNNYKAVGVYVGTENSQFVIAPTLSDSSNIVWSYTDHITPGVAMSNNSEVAKKDYAGKTNTDKIIAELGTSSIYAARYCRDYTFKNGKKGYLWSLGEALDAFNNKAAISQALDKIGGSQMPTNEYFWTSTQYNYYRAWKLSFLYGYEADDSKDSLCYIRAVCAI